MDVSKRLWDGEHKFLISDLLGSQYLFEILQTSLTVKNSENGVKSGCFKKKFAMESANFFPKWGKDIRSLV